MSSFIMGSSCFLHSPMSVSPSSSSSPHTVNWYTSYRRNVQPNKTRNRGSSIVCLNNNEGDSNGGAGKRREILFLGVSILPFLGLKARAFEDLVTDQRDVKTLEEKQQTEEGAQTNASPNHFVSLANGLGIFSSGVIGAFYLLTRQEKKDVEASLESIKLKLKEKEAGMISMEKSFEAKIQKEQEERTKQLKKAKEEEQSLLDQLTSANSTIKGLGQELTNEKKLIVELKIQLDSLKADLSKAGEEKKILDGKLKGKLASIEVSHEKISLLSSEIKDREDTIQNMASSLSEKEIEVDKLNGVCSQTKSDLAKANSEIEKLNEKVVKYEEDIKLKSVEIHKLNASINALSDEKDEAVKKGDAIERELNELKLSSDNAAALSSTILGEKDDELQQVKEKLELALYQATKDQHVIAELTREKDDLRKMLDLEMANIKNLKDELRVTYERLETSKKDANELSAQLKNSKNVSTELEKELFRVGAEFSEAKDSLQKSLDDAKKNSEVITNEFRVANELLKKTKGELQTALQELAASSQNVDLLKQELVDAYKKAESVTNELKEKKEMVASLSTKQAALEKQIMNDKESRKSLQTDLEEATNSLDEMNRNTLLLSKELEITHSNLSVLESERDLLYSSLSDQKVISKEAMENMEDAHNLVMRLGKERESLEKRGKKLEDELASAKGEILRLRSKMKSPNNDAMEKEQISVSKVNSSANDVLKNEQKPVKAVDDAEEKKVVVAAAAAAKKGGRRKKNSNT